MKQLKQLTMLSGLCFLLTQSLAEAQPPGRQGQRGSQAQGMRGGGQGQGRGQRQGQRGGGSAAGGQKQGQGRPGQSGGQSGSQGSGRGQRDPGRADAAFAKQIMTLDENKDGKIVRAELPEHMHKAFNLADADKNHSLNSAELLVLAGEFRRDRLAPKDQRSDVKNQPVGPNGRPGGQAR